MAAAAATAAAPWRYREAVLAFALGGRGDVGGDGAAVTVTNSGPLVTTGANSAGLFAQSVGGGGGNGGFSVAVGVPGVAIGGGGAGGGDGKTVTVSNTGNITTGGVAGATDSSGLVAQSVGGGGGNGGFAVGVGAFASFALGGSGGEGGSAGNVCVNTDAGCTTPVIPTPAVTIITKGDRSNGILAQSIGGGGGNGGFAIAASAGIYGSVSAAFGGTGGPGGTAGNVFVGSHGSITTDGISANGLVAQSIGGGGGNGGFAVSVAVSTGAAASLSFGGLGGAGNSGGLVTVNSMTDITTKQDQSIGIFAQSVGGGGGNGGFAISAAGGVYAGVGLGFGGGGAGGGDGKTVDVTSVGTIETSGMQSYGILAQSLGGGGGNGGFAIAAGVGSYGAASLAFGGGGANGGKGGDASIDSTGNITTHGEQASALFAQSLGGGGGNGGFAVSVAGSQYASLALSFGGSGGTGGTASDARVDSVGNILTEGSQSHGIFAQSIGGSGGNGGFSASGTITVNSSGVSGSLAFGGDGGMGATSGVAHVDSEGDITTKGVGANGIFAQSVAGGGGNGGFSGAIALASGSAYSYSNGGTGGMGNAAGDVDVTSTGNITTGTALVPTANADGILAQSIGGGGGNGGFALTLSATLNKDATGKGTGGDGGTGGTGGTVTVTSNGTINTYGDLSIGVHAQSVGGGGGNGGFSIGASLSKSGDGDMNSVGGSGGSGNTGGNVTVHTNATANSSVAGFSVVTHGQGATGILAQSIGGGGGNGGFSISGSLSGGGEATNNTVGGKGGSGNDSGIVTVENHGNISTSGANASAVIAQSVGGGGGNGGFAIGLGGTLDGKSASNSIGGNGAGGGNAGVLADSVTVVASVTNVGNITTTGASSMGIVAQAIGGGGGNGAFTVAASASTDKAAATSVGGEGGAAGAGGVVYVSNTGDITTGGVLAHGILAESVGGGGGSGGFSVAGGLSTKDEGTSSSTGGKGSGGGNAKSVTVESDGHITTTQNSSSGIIAQSVGGGGGTGGFSGALAITLDDKGAKANSVGGDGGPAGNGSTVTVTAHGVIETHGYNSTAIIAQSIGGGGGNGAFSISVSGAGKAEGASDSVGGGAGAGGSAGQVTVTNYAEITTYNDLSHGILAQSVAGGGGNGGFSVAGTFSLKDKAAASSIGGAGGSAQDADEVHVYNYGNLDIRGDSSIGIFAQSVGGGGGSGGFSGALAISAGDQAATTSVGGTGSGGGDGKLVHVENSGSITMGGDKAIGILAQSVGGGGGNGGFSLGLTGGISDAKSTSDSTGGNGGAAGEGGLVEVTNHTTGAIQTNGAMSYGVFAQSVGGGGGNGGFSVAGTYSSDQGVTGSVGGKGGAGGSSKLVTVTNDGSIETLGVSSIGIIAQSVGGGGGAGGFSGALGVTGSGGVSNSVGGDGGGAGNGGDVTVVNTATGVIHTAQDNSVGILAQSVGGGGGNGAFSLSGDVNGGDGTSNNVGGKGSSGGFAGTVQVTNDGNITTEGDLSFGIIAQSVGGGGGNGGIAVTGALASGSGGTTSNVGGAGGAGNNGGTVIVVNNGVIDTGTGANSVGILAQSVGGGGGSGGFAGDLTSNGGAVNNNVGGTGGAGGDGGNVTVTSSGQIITNGDNSVGVLAQSVAGGGGFGGFSIGVATGGSSGGTLSVGAASTGASGGNGVVTVTVNGPVSTSGMLAYGVLAQGIGAGGGVAGLTVFDPLDWSGGQTVTVGSSGSAFGNGLVTSSTVNSLTTMTGAGAFGVAAQSIGGGGGVGGAAGDVDLGAGTSVLSLLIGSTSDRGGAGSTATLNALGGVDTSGDAAPAVFVQSIGGGGGFGVFVVEPARNTGGSVNIELGGSAEATGLGDSNAGGAAQLTALGSNVTHGIVSPGIVAQSIGGGGGIGEFAAGTGIDLSGAVTAHLGSKDTSSPTRSGTGGAGGSVTATISGTVATDGVLSPGIVAQSIGGGGGLIGFASIGSQNPDLGAVRLGATSTGTNSGSAAAGVTVTNTSGVAITTTGAGSIGILAQAIGGGGGAAQFFGVGIPSSVTYGAVAGAGGDGGTVNVQTASAIHTTGTAAHGIYAQSIGGGGGLYQAFDSDGNLLTPTSVTHAAAASGDAKNVTIGATGGVLTEGVDAVAVYGESSSETGSVGNIEITLGPSTVQGGQAGGTGFAAGVRFVNGADNTLNNGSLLSAGSLLAVAGTTGNETIENMTVDVSADRDTLWAKITGNIDLVSGTAGGTNVINNYENSYIKSHDFIILGGDAGDLYTNSGIESVYDIGVIGLTELTGNYVQTSTGQFVTDLNLDDQTHDQMNLIQTGTTAAWDGTAPLNMIGGVDQLFDEYVLSHAVDANAESGALDVSWILGPTVGFDFKTEIRDAGPVMGHDLVLLADKPTFLSLVQDPASGTTDSEVYDFAQYMDDVEGASSPMNPMARLINMLRFLPDEKTLGETMVRLTPHYAAHSFDVANRVSESLVDETRSCGNGTSALSEDGRCVWVAGSGFVYYRDNGDKVTSRDDRAAMASAGGQAPVNEHWTLGASVGGAKTNSDVSSPAQHLSNTKGELGQGNVYVKYDRGPLFADLVLSGGGGRFKGSRNTCVTPVLSAQSDQYVADPYFIPDQCGGTGRTTQLADIVALPGIGDSVAYEQHVVWAGGSTRLGITASMGDFYVRPQVEATARWLQIGAYEETGSLAAMSFDQSDNVYLSGTPGLEFGLAHLTPAGALRAYVRGGVELTDSNWQIPGGFTAAESLNVPPAVFTEKADDPVGRLDAVISFMTPTGSGLKAGYRGAFSQNAMQHEVFAKVNVSFY